jgi:hypothetical protein
MADTNTPIRDAHGTVVPIDVRTTTNGDARQVVELGNGQDDTIIGPATEATLQSVRDAIVTLEGYTDQLESLLTALGANTDQLEGMLAPSTPANLPGASGAITSATGVLMGLSARETSGTATAFFRLRAGGATGTILATVTLAANESIRDWYGPSGIQATGGVYFELVAGAVAGGVQTR